ATRRTPDRILSHGPQTVAAEDLSTNHPPRWTGARPLHHGPTQPAGVRPCPCVLPPATAIDCMQSLEQLQLRSANRRNGNRVRHRAIVVRPLRTEQTRLSSTDRHVRALNFAIALVAVLLTLPLMAVIAVLVKLTSPGPVLYTQTRVGLDRR